METIAPNASVYLKKAYTAQQVIGWDQLVRGRLSLCWGDLVAYSYIKPGETAFRNIKLKSPAEVWGTKLVVIIWTYVLKLWNARNTSLQKLYASQGQTREHARLLLEATNETTNMNDLLHQDRTWVQRTPDELQTMTSTSLEFWIKNVKNLKTWTRNTLRQALGYQNE